jgi:phage shock protein PspC (stress-responsive transcriptional regulator)
MVRARRRADDGRMSSTRSTGLVRPRDERMIAGVCAGLGRRFGLSATTVRMLFVLSLLLPGPQVLVYLVLWVLMPDEPWD